MTMNASWTDERDSENFWVNACKGKGSVLHTADWEFMNFYPVLQNESLCGIS